MKRVNSGTHLILISKDLIQQCVILTSPMTEIRSTWVGEETSACTSLSAHTDVELESSVFSSVALCHLFGFRSLDRTH